MVEKGLIKQILNDFNKILTHKNILGILLFGSYIDGKETNKSDIDICIVAPNQDAFEILSFIWQNINTSHKKYDVRIFSELPLHIKIQIIEKGITIYTPNKYDLFEFFYKYRKIWEDQKHRQYITKDELLKIL